MSKLPEVAGQPDTVSIRLPEVLPVLGLRVEVLEGPDAGTVCEMSDRITLGTARGNDLVLRDETVSRFHVELIACEDGVRVVDHGSTNGTRIGSARIEAAVADLGCVLRLGHTAVRVVDGRRGVVTLHDRDALGELRGRTSEMRRMMAKITSVAASDVAVLLVGETGTGKELIARALHDHSRRSGRPFVTVDCGALSPQLFAAQLFGHERGAFTGAEHQRAGAFEEAHSGTVFLDEIGEMPEALQAHLLGVLERKRFRRLGGSTEISTDVRIVAATNRDLRDEVNRGRFRLDLYYRVAAARIDVPPLRARLDDIPVLVEHFLRQAGHTGPLDAVIGPGAMAELMAYRWPGNVRELRNIVETTLATGERIELGDVDTRDRREQVVEPYRQARARVLQEFERHYLRQLMAASGGNVSKAARTANMDRSHLTELLRRHDLR